MKKAIFVFVALLAITATKSFAQKSAVGPELSIGLDGGLPLGDFKQGWKFGIGGTAKFAYNVDENFAATFQTGYISFSGKEGLSAYGLIPFKFGGRYTWPGGFYAEPQLGFTSMRYSGASATGFTYAGNIGYRTSPGIDVSARYEGISKSGTLSFIGIRIAYAFPFGSK